MDLELTGKVAFVSGSHRGTGESIANSLAAEGTKVIIHGSEEEKAQAAAANLDNAVAVWGDLTTDSGAQQVIEQTLALTDTLHILVNNYGTAEPGFWEKTATEDWSKMYEKNVLSAVRLINGFLPTIKANAWGRIIQVGTIGSYQPNSRMPHYYAAKGALANLSISLTKELSDTGITVNTVSPGLIKTEELVAYYHYRASKKGWGDKWEDIEKAAVENDFPNPCGRLAEREDISNLVAFLCSPKADYINGQNICVDGGSLGTV